MWRLSRALRAPAGVRRLSMSATDVWTEVNALAARPGTINMGQGFPDFEGSLIARKAAAEAMLAGAPSLNQYSPQLGLLELREAVSDFYLRQHPEAPAYDPGSEVVVCTSGQEALTASIRACIQRQGRRGVLVLEPFYPFLAGAIEMAGGVMTPVRLQPPDFRLDSAVVDAIRSAATAEVGTLVLNSPHNPTGMVATPAELLAVGGLCTELDLCAVSDEVYENAVFGPNARHRRLADVEGMRERTATISSAGKLFSLTGWRVGWALAPPTLATAIAASHTHLTYSAPTPFQVGMAAALREEDGSFGGIRDLFGGNFERLATALRRRGLNVCDAQGGYFLVAETGGVPDMQFVRSLAEETGVVCTPMSVFYNAPTADSTCTLVRFTICKSREHIEKACAALARSNC